MDNSKAINLNEVKTDEPKNKQEHEKSLRKSESGKHRKHKSRKEAWDSGIRVLDTMEVIIPVRLLHVCHHIANRMDGDEFSILTNIFEKGDDTITISDEYYIPKQKVSSMAIDYQPDIEAGLFNTVIHRHPDGMNSFSRTDEDYINQNFELSILYTRAGFVTGVYNLKLNDYLIQIPVDIYIDYGLEDIDISNIEKESRHEFPLLKRIDRTKPSAGIDEWRSDKDTLQTMDKLFPEEKLDYNLMREMLLEEINWEIQNINQRITNIEEAMFHGSFSILPGENQF